MAEVFKQQDDAFLMIEKWQELHPSLIAGFTTRNGGESNPPFDSLNLGLHVSDEQSNIIANRRSLADKLEFPLENWVSGEQVHQSYVHFVTQLDKGKGSADYNTSIKGTDGLITNEAGLLCTAFFADCVPLFFFDPETGYLGIAHAGWKGTVNRIAEQMVEKFESQGVDPSKLLVVIGPCISQENYEVNDHVVSKIESNFMDHTVIQTGRDRYLLDLKQLNVEILLQCGVFRNNIDVTNYCTFKENSLFYSHRRDRGQTGRMLGYIGYRKF
ncbi:conserved hypothetical protein [Oceanobacillus limi]|uniref:Purine nucleoside phosphorylase n=1 Tax=Oceanobacillus limi TaxID=930131 RepID=A0A1I0DEZ5_9BACI|nr:peptidoglycan editing factor PgeF [Oceanobacillus limi]SET30625.1 conserved hypothetical protein [Oceanobacillus limi]